jgi:glycerophosphoryl diester phosphodiesterase
MLDRAAFIRPIAHRGLHDAARGLIENTAPAFEAGLAAGCGLECDLQPAADGTPMVFHDETVDRLLSGHGAIAGYSVTALQAMTYADGRTRILTFAEFLELSDGRGPLLVEIKSDWHDPKPGFLEAIARAASAYRGPIALMSFDPNVMARMRQLAPQIPRGIVAGRYVADGWWLDVIGQARGERLSDLLESRNAAPSFYAYHVKALPTPVTRYVREVQGLPLFTWTVRTEPDRAVAAQWADAPIFEGLIPGA